MSSLADQRCANHLSREAVVRCPGCRGFYCRECVTEHRGRMICAACSAREQAAAAGRARTIPWALASAGGFLIAWVIFYYLGELLARIPSDFFESV